MHPMNRPATIISLLAVSILWAAPGQSASLPQVGSVADNYASDVFAPSAYSVPAPDFLSNDDGNPGMLTVRRILDEVYSPLYGGDDGSGRAVSGSAQSAAQSTPSNGSDVSSSASRRRPHGNDFFLFRIGSRDNEPIPGGCACGRHLCGPCRRSRLKPGFFCIEFFGLHVLGSGRRAAVGLDAGRCQPRRVHLEHFCRRHRLRGDFPVDVHP